MSRPAVIVKQGWLRGAVVTSVIGGSYISFKGIPYAAPPVGNLRFADPQPPETWTGVREALKEGPQCVQLDDCAEDVETDEDCLYLNVATKSLEGSRAVMVWIHGGAFMWGNGGTGFYGPDYLLKKDIVFVSINYRLGVFGFLSLDHEAVPGNMGLKDQVAGLKWVKENIAQFGGDPNNVTIFGESAGGASVHYHLLSPLSEGLFHKAIAQSGVGLNAWASAFKTVEIAHRLVAYLGKETTDPIEIVQYLRTIPALDLADAQRHVMTAEERTFNVFPFAPSVDSKSSEPFLSRPVREAVTEGHDVPLLIGYNSHDGIVSLWGLTDEIDKNVESIISYAILGLPPYKQLNPVKEIKRLYFGDEKVTKDMAEEYIQFGTDCLFVSGINEVVDSRANTKSPTFLYRFSHDSPKKLSTVLWENNARGAAHFDDIAYLFYPASHRDVWYIEPGSTEQIISERFIRMWTDFAKTGDPTPQLDDLITTKWKPVTNTTKNYLEINAELSAGINPNGKTMQAWKRIRDAAGEDQ